jgi:hypothetical protein
MLRVVGSTGSVLRHPLLAHRSKIHFTASGSLEQKQRHREAKQTSANRNPHRDRHTMHCAIMPELYKLRNRFVGQLGLISHDDSRPKTALTPAVAIVVPRLVHRRVPE